MARRVEESLEQQRGFVADASHQLRNPLAAIRLHVDALGHDGRDRAGLDEVECGLDRLEHTVDRMLVLADAEHHASVATGGARGGALRQSSCVASATMLAAPHEARLAQAGLSLVAADEPSRRRRSESRTSSCRDRACRRASRERSSTASSTTRAGSSRPRRSGSST